MGSLKGVWGSFLWDSFQGVWGDIGRLLEPREGPRQPNKAYQGPLVAIEPGKTWLPSLGSTGLCEPWHTMTLKPWGQTMKAGGSQIPSESGPQTGACGAGGKRHGEKTKNNCFFRAFKGYEGP